MGDDDSNSTGWARCNFCWEPLQGAFYHTRCLHAFCENCCFKHFSSSDTCTVCGVRLRDEDFSEKHDLGLGCEDKPETLSFKAAFQSSRLEDVAQTSLRLFSGLEELMSFSMNQLYLECQRLDALRKTAESEMHTYKMEHARVSRDYKTETTRLSNKLKESEARRLRLEDEAADQRRRLAAYERQTAGLQGRSGQTLRPPISPSRSTPPASPSTSFGRQDYRSRDSSPHLRAAVQPPFATAPLGTRGPGPQLPATPQGRRGSSLAPGVGTITNNSFARRLSPHRAPSLPTSFPPRPAASLRHSPGPLLRR